MAISIKDLLKYKVEVPLKDRKGEEVGKVWLRIIGDEDANSAARLARIASTKMRASLRNPETDEYQDQIGPIDDLERDSVEAIIISSRQNRFSAEAFIHVNKEELPTIEEFAEEPDAPTLEEQERLDKAIGDQHVAYNAKIDEYIQERIKVLKAELSEKPVEEVLIAAREELSNILPLQSFFDEYTAQKVFRGTYDDKACTKRTFETIGDFKNSEGYIKDQLIAEYAKLELNPTDIKN